MENNDESYVIPSSHTFILYQNKIYANIFDFFFSQNAICSIFEKFESIENYDGKKAV